MNAEERLEAREETSSPENEKGDQCIRNDHHLNPPQESTIEYKRSGYSYAVAATTLEFNTAIQDQDSIT